MGVDLTVLDFILKFRGKLGGTVLQLGKQGLHINVEHESKQILMAEVILRKYDPLAKFCNIAVDSGSTEKLFTYLGFSRVLSLDASAYEGADIIHDLNTPVPGNLYSSFEAIFDGGTIEHIFNLPIAFNNIKKMLKINGLLLSVNAANNQLGHGFYQFSPELMWRVFSPAAGFRIELMQIVSISDVPEPIDVQDPAAAGRRLEIGSTNGPAYLLVAARKIEDREDSITPQQSDYLNMWGIANTS